MNPRRLAAQTAFELRLLARNGENLLVTLGIPVALLAFFSLVDVLPTDGQAAVDFLVPGILTLSVMGSALVSLAISTGFERSYLVLKRLGVTPLRRSELIAAKGLAVLAVLAVQVAVVLGVAAALGWRVQAAGAQRAAGLTALALLLGVSAFAGLGLAMAGRLRALATLALVNALFVVLLLVSGLVFPLSALPGPLAAGVRFLPSAALAELLRSALSGSGRVVAPAAILGVWAIAMPALAARVFRWD